jgi:hypothetical protein
MSHALNCNWCFLVTHLNQMPYEWPTFDHKEWHQKFLTVCPLPYAHDSTHYGLEQVYATFCLPRATFLFSNQ